MKFHTFSMAIVCMFEFESVFITLIRHWQIFRSIHMSLMNVTRQEFSLAQHLRFFNADISLAFQSSVESILFIINTIIHFFNTKGV